MWVRSVTPSATRGDTEGEKSPEQTEGTIGGHKATPLTFSSALRTLCRSRSFWMLRAILCRAPLVTFCSDKGGTSRECEARPKPGGDGG